MQKFGEFICKNKIIIIIISLLLIIPSIIGYMHTRINYDILVYLPDDIETVQGENILSDEFNMGSYAIILVDNMSNKDISSLEEKIRGIGNVEKVISATDVIGNSIPIEVIPDDIKDKVYKDGQTLIFVTFSGSVSTDETLSSVEEIRNTVSSQCKVSGMSATVLDTKSLSDSEVTIYVIIAVALCFTVLELTLDSYFAPVLLLLNIGIAILYNMGTNVIFGEISYITKAISAVLQLGVTMDFSIFLYHSYKSEKEGGKEKNEAMATAIARTLTSVVGSALTTIAGFLALCSMNLTLGKDIGLVMAKGVFFGIVCVVTVFPSLLLVMDNLIQKTGHKEIFPKFQKLKDFNIKHYKAIIVLFIVLLPFAIYGYNHTKVYYNLDSSLPETLPSVVANNELKDKYNMVSVELLLVDKNLPDYTVNEMVDKIDDVEGVEWTLSYSKLTKGQIPEDILPDDIRKVFESDNYKLILINSSYEMATDELNNQIEQINEIVKSYDSKAILAGEGPLTNDLVKVSDHDFNSVNIVSIAVIFVIMLFVLRSLPLAITLIIVIEFAIFINMGIPAYTGTVIPFVASIVIGTIQLGATIDYAILITTKYKGYRISGKSKKEAIDLALGESIQSIIVSGLCFFAATFGVGAYSKIEMIGSLCTLMARGAIISMITVITVLPAFLMVLDKLICKFTPKMRKSVVN